MMQQREEIAVELERPGEGKAIMKRRKRAR